MKTVEQMTLAERLRELEALHDAMRSMAAQKAMPERAIYHGYLTNAAGQAAAHFEAIDTQTRN
jgi:hypothetical protein